MTTEELSKLTPEEKRIAIVEACGWKKCDPVKFESDKLWHLKGKGFCLTEQLPNYLSDLNAMHEAEKVLTFPQREDYVTLLNQNFYAEDSPNTIWWTNTHATAAQRADAFLLTVG